MSHPLVHTTPEEKEGQGTFVLQPTLPEVGTETMAGALRWGEQSMISQSIQGGCVRPSLDAARSALVRHERWQRDGGASK